MLNELKNGKMVTYIPIIFYKLLELLLKSDSTNKSQNSLSKYFFFNLEVLLFLERKINPAWILSVFCGRKVKTNQWINNVLMISAAVSRGELLYCF